MTQSARLELLERKVRRLERKVAKVTATPEDDRIRARRLVLAELRRHGEVDGVRLAAEHGLVFNDVEEALRDLERMGSVRRVDD